MRESPSYFRFYAGTIRLEESESGEVTGQKLNIRTGFFEPASFDEISEVLGASQEFDLSEISEKQFVKATEEARSDYLQGDAPVFEIYRQIAEIYQAAEREGRRIDPAESAEISALRARTFRMWEDEAARRAAGEPPTFHCSAVGDTRG
ncbi:hypothetical protein IU476_07680 [Nocardia blacklockiae]|nr:hypothetical protein [Nocardia blacklockiae]